MFDTKLQDFLDLHRACSDGITRLQSLDVETLEQAWDKASESSSSTAGGSTSGTLILSLGGN